MTDADLQRRAMELDWLKGITPHSCDGSCPHNAGITANRKVAPEIPGEPSSGNRGMVPGGGDQSPDPLCADCSEPLSAHTSPVLKDGVVIAVAHPENSCRRYIPEE